MNTLTALLAGLLVGVGHIVFGICNRPKCWAFRTWQADGVAHWPLSCPRRWRSGGWFSHGLPSCLNRCRAAPCVYRPTLLSHWPGLVA